MSSGSPLIYAPPGPSLPTLAPSLYAPPAPTQVSGPSHYKAFHKDFKSVLTNYTVRNWLWYIIAPLTVMYTLMPGLLISIPPVRECDGSDKSTWAKPRRVTATSALIHVVVIWTLIILIFYVGSKCGFAFPFTGNVVDALILPPTA